MRVPPRFAVPLAVATHLLLAAIVFPPAELLRDSPLLADDYPNKFWLADMRAALLLEGELVGWAPEHVAGLPVSAEFPSGGPALDLAVALGARPLGAARAFNLASVAFVLAALPSLVLAAWVLGGPLAERRRALASWTAVLGVPLVWSGLSFSFVLTGGTAWLWASAAVPLATLLVVAVLRGEASRRALVAAACVVAALPMIHVSTVPVVVLCAAIGWALHPAGRPARSLGGLVALGAAALVANAFWWVPFLARRVDSAGFGGGTSEIFDPWVTLLAFLHPHGLPVTLAVLALAAVGARRLGDARLPAFRRSLLALLVIVPLVASVVGYASALTRPLEPYRYVLPGVLALLLPAAVALASAPGRRVVALARVLPVVAPATALVLVVAAPFAEPARVRGSAGPELRALLGLLRGELGAEHRLLLEDSAWARPDATWRENLGRGERYFGSHLPVLFPRWTGAESLNGFYVSAFLRQQHLRFVGGELDGRPVDEWSADELDALVRTQGVTHVLVWSTPALQRFGTLPDLVESVDVAEGFELFRVRTPEGRFLRGSGRVRRGADRLWLTELEPEGGEVVLRYHYDDALRSVPPTRIERHPVPGEPVGFVRLVDPPGELVLGFHPERPEPRTWTPPAGTP